MQMSFFGLNRFGRVVFEKKMKNQISFTTFLSFTAAQFRDLLKFLKMELGLPVSSVEVVINV